MSAIHPTVPSGRLKRCPDCGVTKPVEQFSKATIPKDGRCTYCKACMLRRARIWAEKKKAEYGAKTFDDTALKFCRKCGQTKPAKMFHRSATSSDGRMSNCAACINANGCAYQRRPEKKALIKSWRVKRLAQNPRPSLNVNLRKCLQHRPTECPATVDEVHELFNKQNGRCALSGIVMTWGQGKLLPTSISFDRLDHTQGYSINNLRLLCYAINSFRGRMTDAEMLAMAKSLVKNMKRLKKQPKHTRQQALFPDE